MNYPPDLPDVPEEGFFDHEALTELTEKAKDVLRPLGLTVILEMVAVQAAQGQTVLMLPCTIRPSAKTKLDEDKASREALNKMLAEQHEQMIDEQVQQIRSAASDPDQLDDLLFGNEQQCSHERVHKLEGFCLDCGEKTDEQHET